MQKKFTFDYLPQLLYPQKPVRNSFLPHLSRAAKALDSTFVEKGREHGCELTHDQFMLLVAVRENPAATQHELASFLCRERTAVTHALQALVRDGWLERHHSINDRRKCIYTLTAKGVAIWDTLGATAWEVVKQGCADISEADMLTCINTLVKIFCNCRPAQNIYRLHDREEQ